MRASKIINHRSSLINFFTMPEPEQRAAFSSPTLVIVTAIATLLAGVWIAAGLDVGPEGWRTFVVIWAVTLAALPGVAAMWLAACGFGGALRRLWPDVQMNLPEQLACGMAVLLWLLYVAAWAAGFRWSVLLVVLVSGAALNFYQLAPHLRRPGRAWTFPATPWALVLLAAALAPWVAACACPPGTLWPTEALGFDVLTYQLQVPREWLAAGAMTPLKHNVYAFLPGLVNAGYAWLGFAHGGLSPDGGLDPAVYAATWLHASMGVVAALVLGGAVRRWTQNPAAGVIAATLFLATPWALITGSLAYNEMAVCLFAAAALSVLLNNATTRRVGAVVGVLAAAAVMSKLSSAVLVAAPVAGTWLVWLVLKRAKPRAAFRAVGVAALAGLLFLSPYLVRNFAWTGNPTFPFATSVFGRAHWTPGQVARWDAAHSVDFAKTSRLASLNEQWLTNAGYGAVGGHAVERSATNVARFDREGGVPVLWLAVGGAVLLLAGCVWRNAQPDVRGPFAALLALLVLQLIGWLFFTHLQSRFLVPTLVPAALLAGLALCVGPRVVRYATTLALAAVAALLLCNSFGQLQRQPNELTACVDSVPVHVAVTTGRARRGDFDPSADVLRPVSGRDLQANVLLTPGTEPLLYIAGPFVYASAFDRHPLEDVIEAANGDPTLVAQLLHDRGFDRVMFNRSELQRLETSYGDPLSEPAMRLLAAWRQAAGDEPGQPGEPGGPGEPGARVVFELTPTSQGVRPARLNWR